LSTGKSVGSSSLLLAMFADLSAAKAFTFKGDQRKDSHAGFDGTGGNGFVYIPIRKGVVTTR
jgi:hypothetical protein